jgi:hypothetical protein
MKTHLAPNLLDFIRNSEGLIPGGSLSYYYSRMWNMPNANHVYHGLSHTACATWKCIQAGFWYLDRGQCTLDEIHDLIVAVMFHDWNHSKKVESDVEEIEQALIGLRQHILPEDKIRLPQIEKLIRATQFPHTINCGKSQLELAIGDADTTQGFEEIWQQMICKGLAEEMGITPMEMLGKQEYFLTKVLNIKSEWGKTVWTPSVILERVRHVRQLEKILAKGEEIAKAIKK